MQTNLVRSVVGVARFEFLMQLRRPALWLTFLIMAPLLMAFMQSQFSFLDEHAGAGGYQAGDVLNGWSSSIARLLPIVVGLLLADRFARDKRLQVEELFFTYQHSNAARVLGKWLGATGAVLLPVLAVFELGTLFIAGQLHDAGALPLSWAQFAAILPVMFFVAAFSITCPIVLPVPLYGFLLIGYWGWAASLPPHGLIPTVRGTILAPGGDLISLGLFPSWWNHSALPTYGPVSAADGMANIAVLLILAGLGLGAGLLALRLQAARR